MWAVNPTWGSPRIRDELAKVGLEASTATIRKYRPKSGRQPSQSWRVFLQNHAGAIAALDFFVVPTATFRLLYVLLVCDGEIGQDIPARMQKQATGPGCTTEFFSPAQTNEIQRGCRIFGAAN
jgi:hypothetical protein